MDKSEVVHMLAEAGCRISRQGAWDGLSACETHHGRANRAAADGFRCAQPILRPAIRLAPVRAADREIP
jgi:hypothetical protein